MLLLLVIDCIVCSDTPQYLLFSDESLIPLDAYVFNTEAHPLSRLPTKDASSSS